MSAGQALDGGSGGGNGYGSSGTYNISNNILTDNSTSILYSNDDTFIHYGSKGRYGTSDPSRAGGGVGGIESPSGFASSGV